MCASINEAIAEIRGHQMATWQSAEEQVAVLNEDIDRLIEAFSVFVRTLERTLDEPPSLSAPTKLIVLHGPSYYD